MNSKLLWFGVLALVIFGCGQNTKTAEELVKTDENGIAILSDQEIENIVMRSYQYVAMYNVNQKMALEKEGMTTHGYNKGMRNTNLLDHEARFIARPNNDVMYQLAMLDLRKDAVVFEMPAIESKYVSMMVTGYDHYVNIPMSTTDMDGDFKMPKTVLFYTARTENYKGDKVEGIDEIFEMTGDFVSLVLRVMPHANEPERFERIVEQINAIKGMTLSEFLDKPKLESEPVDFPAYGKTDADIFKNNLLEVMQFVFNHTTFDPNNQLDKEVLAAYAPLGVAPGKEYNPKNVVKIDGKKFREVSENIANKTLEMWEKPEEMKGMIYKFFKTKEFMELDPLVVQSVVGPIGQPAKEALYPAVVTDDGEPMNAMNDYVIRMTKDELPPAKGFWSFTLYDTKNGFFIPNDYKKYSVGENGGMKLNADGGIEIYIAAEKPKGVPEENWLPINREDLGISVILRVYAPDLEKMKAWQPPKWSKVSK